MSSTVSVCLKQVLNKPPHVNARIASRFLSIGSLLDFCQTSSAEPQNDVGKNAAVEVEAMLVLISRKGVK